MQAIMSLAGKLFFERPAQNTSLDKLKTDLRTSAAEIHNRLQSASDKPRNREAALHLIGIERWGQRRLQVALGEPLLQDEYDNYRPAESIEHAQLTVEFEQTRQQTLALIDQLQAANTDTKIHHNSFGPMSVRGWLKYLNMHAAMTAKLVR